MDSNKIIRCDVTDITLPGGEWSRNENISTTNTDRLSLSDIASSTRSKLQEHLEAKHPEICNIRQKSIRIKCPEIECGMSSCASYSSLRDHLVSYHRRELLNEDLYFKSEEEFLKWKEEIQKKSISIYVTDSSKKIMKDGTHRQSYNCHRSYNYRSTGQNIRRPKRAGSNKMGATCPSRLEVSVKDGLFSVKFWKTHLGHGLDVEHMNLSKSVRSEIADLMRAGASFDEVLSFARQGKLTAADSRTLLLQRKDLHNICRDFKIASCAPGATRHAKLLEGGVTLQKELINLQREDPLEHKAKSKSFGKDFSILRGDYLFPAIEDSASQTSNGSITQKEKQMEIPLEKSPTTQISVQNLLCVKDGQRCYVASCNDHEISNSVVVDDRDCDNFSVLHQENAGEVITADFGQSRAENLNEFVTDHVSHSVELNYVNTMDQNNCTFLDLKSHSNILRTETEFCDEECNGTTGLMEQGGCEGHNRSIENISEVVQEKVKNNNLAAKQLKVTFCDARKPKECVIISTETEQNVDFGCMRNKLIVEDLQDDLVSVCVPSDNVNYEEKCFFYSSSNNNIRDSDINNVVQLKNVCETGEEVYNKLSEKTVKGSDTGCPDCGLMFTKRKNLYTHLRKFHDYVGDKDPTAWKKRRKDEVCAVCERAFVCKSSLLRHMHKVHSQAATLPHVPRIRCPIVPCEEVVSLFSALRKHLIQFHGIHIEAEDLHFTTETDFLLWKETIQSEGSFFFVSQTSKKTMSDGKSKQYFFCHRSQGSKSTGRNVRKAKRGGSHKIGRTCPARLDVTIAKGKYFVKYWKTHLGHILDVERIPLRRSVRSQIADMLKTGASFEQVLNSFQLEHIDMTRSIKRKDLHNICRDFNINFKKR